MGLYLYSNLKGMESKRERGKTGTRSFQLCSFRFILFCGAGVLNHRARWTDL